MEAIVYNTEGKEAGKVKLPKTVFAAPWNANFVHDVVTAMQANARTPVAHAKDRSEQSGGGRKPWRQKGTGRARHGSRRSPIWRGGGVTFGPRNDKDYSKKVNKKARAKALYITLSRKYKDGEVLFLDGLTFDTPKTSKAKEIIGALSGISGFEGVGDKKHNSVLIALDRNDTNVKKSFNNFGNIDVEETRNLNPIDVMTYRYLVVVNPSESISALEARNK